VVCPHQGVDEEDKEKWNEEEARVTKAAIGQGSYGIDAV
jgi:hypothetical protein